MTTTKPARIELIPIRSQGWRVGLGNLTRKELGLWWRTKLWWIHALIWAVLLAGVSTVVMFDPAGTAEARMNEAIQTFFLVGATAVPIGIVLTLQGAIVGEKELGTAAWVLSKPVSRSAVLVSKLVAHFVGFVATALLIPASLFLISETVFFEGSIDLGAFSVGMAIAALGILFYVVLTLALGCIYKARGPIAGVGITLVLMGQFFKGILPLPLVLATPWLLGDTAASFPMHELPEFDRSIPVIVVVVEIIVLGLVAVWRFNREEF